MGDSQRKSGGTTKTKSKTKSKQSGPITKESIKSKFKQKQLTRADVAANKARKDAEKARAAARSLNRAEIEDAKRRSGIAGLSRDTAQANMDAALEKAAERISGEKRGLLSLVKNKRINNQQLQRLAQINEAMGLNRTTGMGIGQSLRQTVSDPQFKTDLLNLRNFSPTYQLLSRGLPKALDFLSRVGEPEQTPEELARQYSQPVLDALRAINPQNVPISNMPMFDVNPGVRPVDPSDPIRGLIFENTSPVARPNIVDPDTGIPARTEDQSVVNKLMGEILSET
jgi:hypothetical protein